VGFYFYLFANKVVLNVIDCLYGKITKEDNAVIETLRLETCSSLSAVRTTKLCILIYVAPSIVAHFNDVKFAAEYLL